jgi:hypothetical protein
VVGRNNSRTAIPPDEDDFVFITDRKRDVVFVKGLNVFPREVEEATSRDGRSEAGPHRTSAGGPRRPGAADRLSAIANLPA